MAVINRDAGEIRASFEPLPSSVRSVKIGAGWSRERHGAAAHGSCSRGQMKTIFLDIDGVLNCKQTPNPRKFPFIVDPALLARLRRLIELTGAQIVLTSNWRFDPVGMLAVKYYEVPCAD